MGLRFTSLVLVSLFGLVSSCNFTNSKVQTPSVMNADYASIRQHILGPKCMECHNPSSQVADLTTYESLFAKNWVIPGKPRESQLYQSLELGRMPKGRPKLTAPELKLIFDWIDQGATKDGKIKPPVKPEDPPPQPTFAWISKYVFQKSCVDCHKGNNEKTELQLTSYEKIMEYEGTLFKAIEPGDPDSSSIYRDTLGGTMPPKDLPKLNKETLEAIRKWILNGAKKEEP